MIPLGKSLLPPDVREAYPDDLPEEGAFIFWSGWQQGAAARDAYWEERIDELERRLEDERRHTRVSAPPPSSAQAATPVATPSPAAMIVESSTGKAVDERTVHAVPDVPGTEPEIGAFKSDVIVQFVDYARSHSIDPVRARLIVRELLAACAENNTDGNPPSSIVRQIMYRLDEEGIRRNAEQNLGDGSDVRDADVENSAFGDLE